MISNVSNKNNHHQRRSLSTPSALSNVTESMLGLSPPTTSNTVQDRLQRCPTSLAPRVASGSTGLARVLSSKPKEKLRASSGRVTEHTLIHHLPSPRETVCTAGSPSSHEARMRWSIRNRNAERRLQSLRLVHVQETDLKRTNGLNQTTVWIGDVGEERRPKIASHFSVHSLPPQSCVQSHAMCSINQRPGHHWQHHQCEFRICHNFSVNAGCLSSNIGHAVKLIIAVLPISLSWLRIVTLGLASLALARPSWLV